MVHHRFLLITNPIQGQINPTLQFAKRLIALGVHVTLATTVHIHRRLTNNAATIPGLSFATFSDGQDDGYSSNFNDADVVSYISELKRLGSESIRNIIITAEKEGRPFTCLVHTLLLPWAATVAREFKLPSALLWIQAATVFDIYYYYFHDHQGENIIQESLSAGSSCSLELPGFPFSFKTRDFPSFLLPSNTYTFALPSFKEQFEELELETNPMVLVNTFQELEAEALRAVDDKFNMIPIGPLIPSAFLDGRDPSDTSFGGDLFSAASGDNHLEWLDSKAEMSVVYVAFGTLAMLQKRQMEEVARALLDSGFPFLWAIREKENVELECMEELEQVGKIVKWCSQVEVLSHRSVGCFVTHCGWNSTLETLSLGVPVVAFPQWTDQGTNAKLIEDVGRTGVRVDCEVSDEEGVVRGEEIRRCLEVVMGGGEKGEELRRNAEKWKGLARDAVKEGGSSDKNLRSFLDDVAGN